MSEQTTNNHFLAAAEAQILRRLAFAHVSRALVIERVSDNFAELMHQPDSDSIVGRNLTECFYEFIGSEAVLDSLLAGTQPALRIERINRPQPNGELLYFDFVVTAPAEYPNTLLLVAEDATEFGRLEQRIVQERNELRLNRQKLADANAQLRRLNDLKSLFFSMAAHDLRAPLMVIRGYADLLMTVADDAATDGTTMITDVREFSETIGVQSEWLDNIIHNVLDLNRIESDEFHLRTAVADVAALVTETYEALLPMARLNSQTLAYDVPRSGYFAKIDPDRIQQVIHNLVGNAVKYTPPGGVIQVQFSADDDTLTITVKDNGRGMTATQLRDVFDLYYRTGNAKASQIQGTGLGLFIVRTIVDAHGGDIAVQSELDQGATFTVRLPRLQLT